MGGARGRVAFFSSCRELCIFEVGDLRKSGENGPMWRTASQNEGGRAGGTRRVEKKKKKNKLNRYRQQSVDLMKKTNFLQKTKRTVNVDGYEPRRARKNPAPTGKKRRPWHQCAAEDAAPGPHGRQALGRKGVSGPTRRAARGTVYAC